MTLGFIVAAFLLLLPYITLAIVLTVLIALLVDIKRSSRKRWKVIDSYLADKKGKL